MKSQKKDMLDKVKYYVEFIPVSDKNYAEVERQFFDSFLVLEDLDTLANDFLTRYSTDLKTQFPDANNFIVTLVSPAFNYMLDGSEKEKCVNEWKVALNNAKPEILFKETFPLIINSIINARNVAEELNLLDTQEYLNFLDTLNQLSIDQDRN